MQISLAALSLLLFTVCYSEVLGPPFGAAAPTSCCFTYRRKPIPAGNISGYFMTSSRCANPGVIFQTIKKHNICADPSDQWVKTYLEKNANAL
ncbi:C-C motif chemokine 3-like [Bombina bombina]|uniref:C-C motif chemokine 3-like n=1 Tax=Bombina bombina TaxID=8345 RepID=UPI00235AC352|nr:C-C motif chemokine 3-like [Bombina bombina]